LDLSPKDFTAKSSEKLMLRRMVLFDCRTVPWLEYLTFLELLDIKFIQLERRPNFKTYWALTPQMVMPRNANPFPERGHVAAFSQ
jgi:hypothetical protein